MKSQTPKTAPLGELILAVFDKAAQYSADPREVSRLGAETVARILWRTQNFAISRLSHLTKGAI